MNETNAATFTTLPEAQAEIERLRAQNEALQAIQPDVRRDAKGRPLLTREQMALLSAEAARAHIAAETARLYLSVARRARPGEAGGGREPEVRWGDRARL